MELIENEKKELLENNQKALLENKPKVKKAMILAGGLGTRFLPATLAVAKELVTVGNKPILMYHLEDLAKAGITDVLIIGNKLKEESFKNFINPPKAYIDQIEADGKMSYLKDFNDLMSKIKISYINQDDKVQVFDGKKYENDLYDQRGSAIAIYAGKNWAGDEPFVVMNGDDLCLYDDGRSATKEVVDVFEATGDWVVYGKEVDRNLIYKYSSMVLGENISNIGAKMKDIIEKPAKGTEPSNIMGFSRYIYTKSVYDRIKACKPRSNGEYCITDVLAEVAREGKASTCIFGGDYFDCGSIAGYSLANLYMGLANADSSEVVREGAENLLDKFLN